MEKARTSNWTQLPQDLIGSIANQLGAIEDFVAFSSVCTSWRSSLLFKHQQKRCAPWLLLPKRDDWWNFKYREFFSFHALNKKRNQYNVKEPLIINAKRCWGSSIGWIFALAHDNTTALVNPLTGVHITLPPFTKSIKRALVFINGTDDNNNNNSNSNINIMVMVITDYQDQNRLAFARPGFGEWITLQDHENRGFVDVAWYKDRILGVRSRRALVTCETDNVSGLRVTGFAPPPEVVNFDYGGQVYLIESEGDLLMVLIRSNVRNKKRGDFKVYKFDIESRRWGELDDLGDRALFLGDNYSITVFPANEIDCIGNCIYTSTSSGLVKLYMKDKRAEVYSFHYFSKKYGCSILTLELANLHKQFKWGPVWVMPSLS